MAVQSRFFSPAGRVGGGGLVKKNLDCSGYRELKA